MRESRGMKKLLGFILPFWHILLLCLILTLITSTTTLIFPWLIKELFNSALVSKDITALKEIILFAFAILGLEATAGYLQVLKFAYLGASVGTNMRITLFDNLQNASFRFFQKTHTGDMVSRLMNDVGTVQNLLTSEITNLVRQPLLLIGGFILMLTLNLKLSLFIALFIPIFAIVATPLGRKVKDKAKAMQVKSGEMTSLVQDTLSGILVVKAFLLEKFTLGKLQTVSREFIDTVLKNAKYRALMSSSVFSVERFPSWAL